MSALAQNADLQLYRNRSSTPVPTCDPYNAFSFDHNPHDAHLHATIQRIDELANRDIDMQAPLSEGSTYLVVDTNILIQHFDVISEFVEDAEKHSLPIVVVIPGVVIYELDGQKNRDGLAWFARRASSWLLKKVRERKIIKGQANGETCKASRNWKIKDAGEVFSARRADALIIDCCLYFRRSRQTFLCSADKNLCIESESETAGIPTISPTRNWSSQEIALKLFGKYEVDLSQFGAYHASYKDPETRPTKVGPPAENEDDKMEVDDDASTSEVLQPSHALDSLHDQIVEHFTSLLVDLVGRVGGPEIHGNYESDEGSLASRYAPQRLTQRRSYLEWGAADALEYLNDRRRMTLTSPRVEIFLSKPYSIRGARRGQDWSRRDWEVALGGLARIGTMWEEASIIESLRVLDSHVKGVFGMKMRPTGI